MTRPVRPQPHCSHAQWLAYMRALDSFNRATGETPRKEARP